MPRLLPANLLAVRLWCYAALTVFANGCVAGAKPRSLTVGGGMGGVATGAGLDLHASLLMGAAAFVLSAVLNGWEHVHEWHASNQIPNPWLPSPARRNATGEGVPFDT